MKIKDSSLNERGIAHLGLIVLIVAVIGLGVFAYMRVSDSNKTDETGQTTSSQSASTEDEDQQTADAEAKADQAGAQADSTDAAASVQESENVTE